MTYAKTTTAKGFKCVASRGFPNNTDLRLNLYVGDEQGFYCLLHEDYEGEYDENPLKHALAAADHLGSAGFRIDHIIDGSADRARRKEASASVSATISRLGK